MWYNFITSGFIRFHEFFKSLFVIKSDFFFPPRKINLIISHYSHRSPMIEIYKRGVNPCHCSILQALEAKSFSNNIKDKEKKFCDHFLQVVAYKLWKLNHLLTITKYNNPPPPPPPPEILECKTDPFFLTSENESLAVQNQSNEITLIQQGQIYSLL